MKKLLFILVLCLIPTMAFGQQWDKDAPAGSNNASDIDYYVENNQVALDRMLAGYRKGMKLSYSSAAQVSVAAGEIMVENSDSSVRLMMRNTSATTIAWTDIDTGAEEASTTYYVYAVAALVTSEEATFKISKSATAPTGETYYTKIGSFYNDSSSNILNDETVTNDDNYYALSLGDWVAKSVGTTYQASTDGIVTLGVTATSDGGDVVSYSGYTDNAAAPTTLRATDTAGVYDGDYNYAGFSFPVKKADYYKITASTLVGNGGGLTVAMFWIPNE